MKTVSKWTMCVVEMRWREIFVEVEANNYGDAVDKAKATAKFDDAPVQVVHTIRNYLERIPIHVDGNYMDSKRLFVFRPPSGGVFNAKNIEALLAIVQAAGCDVCDYWNGAGCDTFSVRLNKDLTDKQIDDVTKTVRRQWRTVALTPDSGG